MQAFIATFFSYSTDSCLLFYSLNYFAYLRMILFALRPPILTPLHLLQDVMY